MKPREFGFRDVVTGIKSVLKIAMRYKRMFFASIVFVLIIAAISPLDSILFGRFIDALQKPTQFFFSGGHSIPSYTAILIAWAFCLIINIIIQRYSVVNTIQLAEFARRSFLVEVSEHLFRLPLSFHKGTKSGETQEKLATAANAIGNILENIVVVMVQQTLSMIIFLVVIFKLNLSIFIFALCVFPFFIFISLYIGRGLAPLQKQINRAYHRTRGGVVDAITNIRIVKDFGAESHQTEVTRKGYFDEAIPLYMKYMSNRRNQNLAQNIIIVSSRAVVLIASIFLVRNGSWTIGDLVLANMYINSIFQPLIALSNNSRDLENGVIAIEDVQVIMDMPTEPYTSLPNPSLGKLNGGITFDNVSFGYEAGRTVLHDISFTVEPGQIIALVGESGVGKSSLIDMVSRYYSPTKGSVLVDGKPIDQIPLEELRHNIAVVTQEITLFNDTIINNIRYGNFEHTDEEVMTAAKRAHCDFIERFPERWHQVVGERGLRLSVGQKQRVAIARAVLKNPKILILDEPTSALDAGSEKIITESLDELMKGKTTFVIAHRLSTVRRADKILVFKEGRIIESGTHDELLKILGGEYRRLYELQIGLHA